MQLSMDAIPTPIEAPNETMKPTSLSRNTVQLFTTTPAVAYLLVRRGLQLYDK